MNEKVLPLVFEEVSWNIIVKAIERYNLSAKMSHIGKILLEYMKVNKKIIKCISILKKSELLFSVICRRTHWRKLKKRMDN